MEQEHTEKKDCRGKSFFDARKQNIRFFIMIDRNEGDSAVVGVVGYVYNRLFMELWVTLFAGCGKAAL